MTDLITIGITCYNARDHIKRAITSAFVQDWPNFEILIVDDCSNDDSPSLIRDLISGHNHARLIVHEKNTGAAGARQTIIENAKGAFIVFFDDDDESFPDRIRMQIARILSYESTAHTKLIACYASGTRLYPNGYTVDLNAIGSRPIIPQGRTVADSILFFGRRLNVFYGAGTPTCALMARTETFVAAGGFDPAFRRVEDLDFAIRLSLAGGHFIGCPEKLFLQHATTGNDKTAAKNLEAELALAQKHKAYLQSIGMYEYARTWPKIRYYHFIRRHDKMLLVLLGLLLRYPIKVTTHILQTGSRRWLHERKMNKTK